MKQMVKISFRMILFRKIVGSHLWVFKWYLMEIKTINQISKINKYNQIKLFKSKMNLTKAGFKIQNQVCNRQVRMEYSISILGKIKMVWTCWYLSRNKLKKCKHIISNNLSRLKRWWFRCKSLNNGHSIIFKLKLMIFKIRWMLIIFKKQIKLSCS